MANKSFTQNNIDMGRYRKEILPVVRGAAEAGLTLDEVGIPPEFRDQANEDFELASSSLADNAMADLTGVFEGLEGMGKAVASRPVSDIDLQTKSPDEIGGDALGQLMKQLLGNGGAEQMAASAIDEPLRILSDPKGEAKAHPVMAAVSAIPIVGAGFKKLVNKFKKIPDVPGKKLPDEDDLDIDIEVDDTAGKNADVRSMVLDYLDEIDQPAPVGKNKEVDDLLKGFLDEPEAAPVAKSVHIKKTAVDESGKPKEFARIALKKQAAPTAGKSADDLLKDFVDEPDDMPVARPPSPGDKEMEMEDFLIIDEPAGAASKVNRRPEGSQSIMMAQKASEAAKKSGKDLAGIGRSQGQMAEAERLFKMASTDLAKDIADAKAEMAAASKEMRSLQGRGEAPSDALVSQVEEAQRRLEDLQGASEELELQFLGARGDFLDSGVSDVVADGSQALPSEFGEKKLADTSKKNAIAGSEVDEESLMEEIKQMLRRRDERKSKK